MTLSPNTRQELAGTLVYIAYGKDIYHYGAFFSLLTAIHLQRATSTAIRYVIYTDRPAMFDGMDVHIEALSREVMDGWLEGSDYVHRIKPQILKDALSKFGGSVVLVDTDTYFRKAPGTLFQRVAPGIACLHVKEGRLDQTGTDLNAQLIDLVENNDFHDLDRKVVSLSKHSPMWNSGVIGLHEADRGAIDEMIGLIDQLWIKGRVSLTEQFVAGAVLARRCTIKPCLDVVFHYWEFTFRSPFEMGLPDLCRELMALPPAQRPAAAYGRRPKPAWRKRLTGRMRIALRALGADVKGAVRSV